MGFKQISKGYIYGMVEPCKMHRFEPDLDDSQRSLDSVKTDELDSYRIAIYGEQNHKKSIRTNNNSTLSALTTQTWP